MEIILLILFMWGFYNLQDYIYRKKCFNKLSVEMKFSSTAFFEGERIEFIHTVINKKILPLGRVELKYMISRYLKFEGEETLSQDKNYYRSDVFSLLPYHKLVRRYKLTGMKRGYYQIKNPYIITSDLFGMNEYSGGMKAPLPVFVYPKLININKLKAKLHTVLGDALQSKSFLTDPFMIRGIRDYYPYDNMKSINWTASAKTGMLKVNEYENTVSNEIRVLLNLEKGTLWQKERILEETISLGASLMYDYLKSGARVSLRTNGINGITNKEIELNCISGVNSAKIVFESLSVIDTDLEKRDFGEIIREEVGRSADRQSRIIYVLISHCNSEELAEEIKTAKKRGINIEWVIPVSRDMVESVRPLEDAVLWEVGA